MHAVPQKPHKKRRWLWAAIPLGVLLLLFCLNLALQTFWAHRQGDFVPDYEMLDLSPLLGRAALSGSDYDTIFRQTGLAKPAVDDLLRQGEQGLALIRETQRGFFGAPAPECVTLIGGRFTCEDRLRDAEEKPVYSVPLAPLKAGDIILTFSTHTFGWRHGHASLVVDPVNAVTLEAVMMGSDSALVDAQHWRTYSNFMVLRVKDAAEADRLSAVRFALDHLNEIPYSLLAGIFGEKAPDPADGLTAQCAYLPWRAWQSCGRDLDSDGGRIVTVLDLAESPLLEVVQVYGMDPALTWRQ